MGFLEQYYLRWNSDIRPSPPQYQVFINFRGADLREGFLEVLVQTLKKEQVNVFVDNDEVRGGDLNILFDRIEESRVVVTIFSERYTESKWCLDELVKIKKCMDQGSLQVIPIFFNVETEDVKNLEGNFGRNFRKLKKTYHKEKKLMKKWEEALMSVSRKFGLSSEIRYHRNVSHILLRSRYEKGFAKLIAENVKKMLTKISEREEQLAEAKRNSLLGKAMKLIKSGVPRGVIVFLITMLIAPYLLCFIYGILYYSGSIDNQSKLNGTDRWINNDRVVFM